MNQIKHLDSLLCLVGLQMADEMPGHLAVQCLKFFLGFLNPVLANIGHTGIDCLPHGIYIVIFGNCYQQNIMVKGSITLCLAGLNIAPYLLQPFLNHQITP